MTIVAIILTVAAVALITAAVYASAAIGSGVYVKAMCRAATDEKVVALTFDDAPDPIQTPKVLEVLRQHHVHATFFCIGNQAEAYPDIVRQITADGHLIGNHSYSHSNCFPLFSRRKMQLDLERCDTALAQCTPTGNDMKLFRPPFGVTNPTVASAVKSLGYTVIGWNIRSFDTARSTESAFYRICRRMRPGSIVLLHDRLPNSHILLERLLKYLHDNDYRIERVDRMLKLTPKPQTNHRQ